MFKVKVDSIRFMFTVRSKELPAQLLNMVYLMN